MIKAQNPADQKLLEGILAADNQSVRMIYDLILPAVILWVKENNGTESDARDIFQEAIIALFRRVETGNFTLTCTLKSYVRVMCRNLWLTRIRDNKKFSEKPPEDLERIDLDKNMVERLERSEREQVFFKHFDALGENCQKILKWFFEKIPLKKIAEKLDTSESYIKKRKFICKEKLVKAIQADTKFEELKNG
ncbi:MAG: sigma-70 family RNA polymerase sigma factor [Bacteroidota bacterium]